MTMSTKDATFWDSPGEHESLAKHFERNIELRSPSHFDCKLVGGHCPYCATSVTYPTYTGESV